MTATPLATTSPVASPSRARLVTWAGRVLTGIVVLFLTFDVAIKFFATPEALAGTAQLGWQPHHLPVIGTLGLVCLVLYLVPRTAPLGAILWTGYLGGAIATHVRLDNPLFSHVLFPVYVAAFLWGGLYLRDARVRNILHGTR